MNERDGASHGAGGDEAAERGGTPDRGGGQQRGRDAPRPRDTPRGRDAPRGGSGSLARDLLANERTLLAWIRTALGLLAAGLALPQLLRSGRAGVVGVVLLVLGGAAAGVGYRRFAAADTALRRGDELPDSRSAPFALAAAVVVLALLAVAMLLVGD